MNDQREARLRLEPSVSEEFVRRVVLAGHSPNEFASWVLSTVDVDGLLARFGSLGGESGGVGRLKPEVETDDSHGSPPPWGPPPVAPAAARGKTWSRGRFHEFMDLVESDSRLYTSLALLGAYLRLGPVPTSDGLRHLCGFEDDAIWQQALRVAKQRLTLQARRVGASALFPRAKTSSEGERLHPIEPRLFAWLKEWATDAHGDLLFSRFPNPEDWGRDVAEAEEAKEVTE